ncbi:MAG: YihY/virulence factor BrkB family protein [Natrialbaceae archaeon]|nr:YihY/virulence factor BrkB family protein [Natrialbaceae archaeon]
MARKTVVSLYRTASDRDISDLAAGFAYDAFVSLIPLVLLGMVVSSLIGGQELAAAVAEQFGEVLPASGQRLLVESLSGETGRIEATVIAILVATWGSLRVFRGLSRAFNRIYGESGTAPIAEQVVGGITVMGGILGAMILMLVSGVVIGLLPAFVPSARRLGWIILIGGLFVAFLPMYYVLPPVDVSVREILPGAITTTLGWTALQWGFQFYAAVAGQYEAYGLVGAVLLFVTWLYFAGMISSCWEQSSTSSVPGLNSPSDSHPAQKAGAASNLEANLFGAITTGRTR